MASLPASPSSWTDPWTSTRAFASRAPAPSPSRGSRPSPGTSTSARAVARDRALPTHLASLLAQPDKYLEYFAWKRAPLPSAFQHRLAFVGTHAKCRLCRWAYAKKFGFRWSRETQEVVLERERVAAA